MLVHVLFSHQLSFENEFILYQPFPSFSQRWKIPERKYTPFICPERVIIDRAPLSWSKRHGWKWKWHVDLFRIIYDNSVIFFFIFSFLNRKFAFIICLFTKSFRIFGMHLRCFTKPIGSTQGDQLSHYIIAEEFLLLFLYSKIGVSSLKCSTFCFTQLTFST